MKNYGQVAGFILAGGSSSRMGADKGLLDFGGVPLVVRTARVLERLVAEVTVVGAPHRYEPLGLRAIADHAVDSTTAHTADDGGCGPLAGIAAALCKTSSDWNLIVACDMPYLSVEWLNWLISRAISSGAEAVVPETERGLEPLAAVYRRDCGPALAETMGRGVRRVTDAISELQLELVHADDWRHVDPAGVVLKNMNAPEDYAEALQWWTGNPAGTNQRVKKSRRARERGPRSAPRPRK